MLASFQSSYIAEHMMAGRFLSRGLGNPADRRAAVADAAARGIAPELAAELARQNPSLPPIENGTALVVSGQQMGLFLGPLFTLHKAASAVVLARRLAAETGTRVAPLFWLQCEDHDFAEIAVALTPRRDGTLFRSALPDDGSPARCPIAARACGENIVNILDQLAEELAGRPFADETMAVLRASYRPAVTLVEAFTATLRALMAETGLYVFGPRNLVTARLAAPIWRRAIAEWQPIEQALVARIDEMTAAGLAAPIQIRAGSPLPFWHVGGIDGERQRLVRDGAQWRVSGHDAVLSDREVYDRLEQEPLGFSSSAILRPVVQDALLPVAAYVGGPAEVGYLAEAQPIYRHLGVTPSLVAPRASLALVPPIARRALAALGIARVDLEDTARIAALAAVRDDDAPSVAWAAELDQKLAAAGATDPSLASAVAKTRGTIHHALERFAERYERAAATRSESTAARLRRARAWLRPDGAPQERTLAFPAFAAEVGIVGLRERILGAIDPLVPSLREVEL